VTPRKACLDERGDVGGIAIRGSKPSDEIKGRRDNQSFIRKSGGSGEVAGVHACGAKGGGSAVSGHIPDAALVEWKDIAVKTKAGSTELYDMVPDKGHFEKPMRESGVNTESAIVIANPGDEHRLLGGTSVRYFCPASPLPSSPS